MDWESLTRYVDSQLVNPSQIHQEHRMRVRRSAYDNVSVQVQIEQYTYVLSRFNLSRYLTACMIPTSQAVDISRKIKKEFVDALKFQVTQEELTERVLELMAEVDRSQHLNTVGRFQMIQKFNFERIPLIIFLAGTGFIGKSQLAFRLGERLNISTILQTDIACELASHSGDPLGNSLWFKKHESIGEFLHVFKEWAVISTKAISGDIVKTLADGKPLILEGIHLDPKLFLKLCGKNALNDLSKFDPELLKEGLTDKLGFILPLLVTRPEHIVRQCVRSTVLASMTEKALDVEVDVDLIGDYAVAVQNYLAGRFPPEYTMNIQDVDAVESIHSLFLQALENYYANRT